MGSREPEQFRCFHCRKLFDSEAAKKHFGPRALARPPMCQTLALRVENRLRGPFQDRRSMHAAIRDVRDMLAVAPGEEVRVIEGAMYGWLSGYDRGVEFIPHEMRATPRGPKPAPTSPRESRAMGSREIDPEAEGAAPEPGRPPQNGSFASASMYRLSDGDASP